MMMNKGKYSNGQAYPCPLLRVIEHEVDEPGHLLQVRGVGRSI